MGHTLFFRSKPGKFPFLPLVAGLLVSGSALIALTLTQGVPGWRRMSLLIMGSAPVAFAFSIVLHNGLSALLGKILKREFEEPVFFLLAIFACPVAFVVGTVGGIVGMLL